VLKGAYAMKGTSIWYVEGAMGIDGRDVTLCPISVVTHAVMNANCPGLA
jgi:hypothetical protein